MAATENKDSVAPAVKPEPLRTETKMAMLLQFNWGSSLLRTLHSMRESNDGCDTVITVRGDAWVNAHSALLSAASPKFKSLLQDSDSDRRITLEDVSVGTITAVLDFIYLGQAEVPASELDDVQRVAEQFDIAQLIEVCQRVHQEKTMMEDLEGLSGSSTVTRKSRSRGKAEVGKLKREGGEGDIVDPVKVETCDAGDDEEEEEDGGGGGDGDDDDYAPDGDDDNDVDNDSVKVKTESKKEYRNTRGKKTRRKTKTTAARKKLAQKANLLRSNNIAIKKSGNWVCEKCGRKFKVRDGLRKHLRSHKEDDPCRCYLCDEEFDDEGQFRAHLEGHVISAGTFKCAVCDVVVAKKSALRDHVVRVHGQKYELKCQICGKTFPTRNALTVHRQEHAGQKRHQCEYCAREFFWRSNLKEHVRVHTGERPFACIHCDKTFTHNTNRKVHQRWHHTHDKLPPCNDKICNDPRGLERRKKPRLIHKCQICSQQFSRKDSYTKHMHRHNGTHAFCCDYCGKGFMERECFDTHIKGHQGIASSFQCSVCKLVVTTKKGLQKHMRTMHERDKQYQCTVCGVTFVHRSSFVAHAMIHSGQKPYRCDQCDRTFRCSSHLKGHLRIHTGEKPYACSYCAQKFAHNNSRKAHERQHHPDKAGTATVKRAPSASSAANRKRKAEEVIVAVIQQQETPSTIETQPIEVVVPAEIPGGQHSQQQVVGEWDTDGMYIVREGMAEHIPLSRMHGRDRQYAMVDETQGLLTGSGEMSYTMWTPGGTVAYPTRSEN